ncbi:Hypothetical protein Minf_0535 [Methylacidiphilum infernorum V4]|uniref:Uncharacterized protein n=1 Tax=Methylacidiphilum infernorum (isolate V4) TaxID=481448 RepID=B3DZH6_METI4|nr:Hypothetical protein Minf_0535 [Methylacidiphilum infernorum V4]
MQKGAAQHQGLIREIARPRQGKKKIIFRFFCCKMPRLTLSKKVEKRNPLFLLDP